MKNLLILLIVIGLLGGGYVLLSPLVRTDEVNEDLPFDVSQLKSQIMDKTKEMNMKDIREMVKLPEPEELEKMTEEAKKSVERSIVEKMNDYPDVEKDEPMEDAMSDEAKEMMKDEQKEPTLLASGSFQDGDSFHKGSGDAFVYELPDGQTIVRFEDFDVTNGPDLFVYLATDASASDFVDLGRLKGNKGNQNYTIPAGTDLEKYDTVLIWCRAFSVLFSTAGVK